MSEIKEKVDNELKTVKSLCETIENSIKSHVDKGLDKINTHELYEAVDIYKDLSEVKKNIVKTCYYMQIMKAMEESEYGEDYDENGRLDERRYYNAYRYADGRYAPKGRGTKRGYVDYMYPLEHYRDMDRMTEGRMYYHDGHVDTSKSYSDGFSEGNTRGYSDGYSKGRSDGQRMNVRDGREGRSGMSRRSYMETKEMHSDNTPENKQKKLKELENYMNELSTDMTEMISGASNEEKTVLKQKLQNLSNKII